LSRVRWLTLAARFIGPVSGTVFITELILPGRCSSLAPGHGLNSNRWRRLRCRLTHKRSYIRCRSPWERSECVGRPPARSCPSEGVIQLHSLGGPSEMPEGTIKRKTDKGFGFIATSHGKEIFFHKFPMSKASTGRISATASGSHLEKAGVKKGFVLKTCDPSRYHPTSVFGKTPVARRPYDPTRRDG
jgi:hypothetical protein